LVSTLPVDDELGDLGRQRWIAGVEGIEQPHLDIPVRVERVEDVVLVVEADVVQKHAYAHAAVGCCEQALGHEPAGVVVVEDVVLQVDRMRRVVDQRDAAHQGIVAARQQAKAGNVAVLFHLILHVASRRRVVGGRHRRGWLLDEIRSQRRAGRGEHGERNGHGDLSDTVPQQFPAATCSQDHAHLCRAGPRVVRRRAAHCGGV
jgi:hypothetical protein